jgi:hypothetical protein
MTASGIVERLTDIADELDAHGDKDDAQAVREAASELERLRSAGIGGAWKVKELEWKKNLEANTLSHVETIVGRYRVWTHHEAKGRWFWNLMAQWREAEGECATEAEAKAAAQQDYEKRIMSALSPAMLGEEWKVVPVEPTPEMYGAGGVQMFKNDMAQTPVREALGLVYRAMVSAAPSIIRGG